MRIPDYNRKKRRKPLHWKSLGALLVLFFVIPALIILISDLIIFLLNR